MFQIKMATNVEFTATEDLRQNISMHIGNLGTYHKPFTNKNITGTSWHRVTPNEPIEISTKIYNFHVPQSATNVYTRLCDTVSINQISLISYKCQKQYDCRK